MEIKKLFENNILLFKIYWCKLSDNKMLNQTQAELAGECLKRLNQLRFLITKIKYLENLANPRSKNKKNFVPHERIDVVELTLEIELLTESFYYIGSRLREILRYFPGLGKKKFEAKGVRDVRNHLIEHPEGASSKVFAQSFCHGGPNGPVIKGGRFENQKNIFPDLGLYANAKEFSDNLEIIIKKSLENLRIQS